MLMRKERCLLTVDEERKMSTGDVDVEINETERRRSFTFAFKCEARDGRGNTSLSESILLSVKEYGNGSQSTDDIPHYHRKKMKIIGAGRKPYYPNIDKAMLDF